MPLWTASVAATKGLSLSLGFLLVLLLVPPAAHAADPKPAMVARAEYGFELEPRAQWRELDERPKVAATLVYAGVGKEGPVLRVYRRRMRLGAALDQEVAAWRELNGPQITYERQEDIKIGGLPAAVLTGQRTQAGETISERAVLVRRGGDAYVVHFVSSGNHYAKLMPDVLAMEQSLRFVGTERTALMPAIGRATSRPATTGQTTVREPTTRQAGPSAAALATVKAAAQTKKAFSDADAGLRLTYPGGWKTQEPETPAIVLQVALPAMDRERGEPRLLVAALSAEGVPAKSMARVTALAAAVGSTGAKIDSSEEMKIGGEIGYLTTAQFHADGVPVKSVGFAVKHKDKLYTLSFSAGPKTFEAWWPQVQALLESIQWMQ